MHSPASRGFMLAMLQIAGARHAVTGWSGGPSLKECYVCGKTHREQTKYCSNPECEKVYKKR